MAAYYNEFDPFAAAWLRELIKDGLIADGVVDERSICDVQADDLSGFNQVHFFAGIGGWSYALRLAGWADDRPVWTGSCPCQPFSTAGKQKGVADERHLWPEMFRLISECRPATVFGEQVEAAVRLGWVDGVRGDLEGKDYAFGFHVLGAHSVGSPHIRQRIYWVGDSNCEQDHAAEQRQQVPSEGRGVASGDGAAISGNQTVCADGLADTGLVKCDKGTKQRPNSQDQAERLPETNDNQRCGTDGRCWDNSITIQCRDGKQRRISPEPEVFPLATRLSNHVGALRGAGNAIVPQVAAEFIKAYCEIGE